MPQGQDILILSKVFTVRWGLWCVRPDRLRPVVINGRFVHVFHVRQSASRVLVARRWLFLPVIRCIACMLQVLLRVQRLPYRIRYLVHSLGDVHCVLRSCE